MKLSKLSIILALVFGSMSFTAFAQNPWAKWMGTFKPELVISDGVTRGFTQSTFSALFQASGPDTYCVYDGITCGEEIPSLMIGSSYLTPDTPSNIHWFDIFLDNGTFSTLTDGTERYEYKNERILCLKSYWQVNPDDWCAKFTVSIDLHEMPNNHLELKARQSWKYASLPSSVNSTAYMIFSLPSRKH